MSRISLFVWVGGLVALSAHHAHAEPMFLSKQYNRCRVCHYSSTSGGLLTPYGRSLSARELSTTGKRTPPQDTESASGEEAFLYGALGNALGPLHLGIGVRPAHLRVSGPGFQSSRNVLMEAELMAVYEAHDWIVYGQIGRHSGGEINSNEHWVARQSQKGFGFRAGRFMPAYGIQFVDDSAYNRHNLGFDDDGQVYGVEVSRTSDRYLLQVSVSPGRAESVIDNDGRRAFTATERLQFDLGPRTTLVASGLYRNASTLEARTGAFGLALGFAPSARLNTWTEVDARFQRAAPDGPSYILVNETAFEVFRGVWLKFSPQMRTDSDALGVRLRRAVFAVELLPRTHWNIEVSYDRERASRATTKTLIFQLHLYL